jgi:hypothetical protein
VLKGDQSVIIDFQHCQLKQPFSLIPSLHAVDLGQANVLQTRLKALNLRGLKVSLTKLA